MSATSSRRRALRGLLSDAHLDSLLVTDLINIRYLTGFTGSNAAVLIRIEGDEESVFCTDGRYEVQSAAEVPDLPRKIDRACDLALLGGASGRVGFEALSVSVSQHTGQQAATAADVELIATESLVEQLRAVKDPGEIDALRTACAVADRALAELIELGGIGPGRPGREVALCL